VSEAPRGTTPAEAAALADKYEQMLRLADLFDGSGSEMRARARLGEQVLKDPGVAESAELSPTTYAQLDEDVRRATTGRRGLFATSVELDADALIVRATVQTYRWIDELQEAAYRTLGSIAGRAIGYLAPQVALGGAIVSAGLIETDALDRDSVAAYLDELAENNPELMDHVTSGGGLLDGLQLRSLLTAGVLAGESGAAATRGGLRAAGVAAFPADLGSALRDVAGGVVDRPAEVAATTPAAADRPSSVEELMSLLSETSEPVTVRQVAPGRYIAFLPGPHGGQTRRLRLVGGDHLAYAEQAVRAIEAAVAPGADGEVARVMLVGCAQGGVTAVDIATHVSSDAFVVDQVITAGAPSALVPRVPADTRVLSLEDRSDPVALLGSLVNAGSDNRLTVVFDDGDADGSTAYVVGGRAADAATHPQLRDELSRIRELGYLA
jgi:hypothetical protein